jgi:hypothetical protein
LLFINLPIHQPASSSTCQFINLPIHQLANSSTFQFINFRIHQLAVLVVCANVSKLIFWRFEIAASMKGTDFVHATHSRVIATKLFFSSSLTLRQNKLVCSSMTWFLRGWSDVLE